MSLVPLPPFEPSRNCPLCPRLVAFREAARLQHPDWHNAPVANFGDPDARIMIAGLAPGLRGANRTGRPFTGDYAGVLLYDTLKRFGLAEGTYDARPDDGLRLKDCIIANSVRCVPPENKPTPEEIRTCNPFQRASLEAYPNVVAIITLGRVAHDATLMAMGLKKSAFRFGHGAVHEAGRYTLFNTYHCSRYNTQTNRLTAEMFADVIGAAAAHVRSMAD